METDPEQHPRADDLRFPLPDGWYLHEKEDYGDQMWFCQHQETVRSTQTYESPETAAQYAHKKHREEIDPDHTLPWENEEMTNDKMTSEQALQPTTNLPERQIEVFDADAGDMVERSPRQQRKAMHLMRAIQMSTMVQAVALARMEEGKHHLDLGHSSFKEFVSAELPFAYSTARMYLKIGRRFQGLLPEADASEEATREALEAQIEESDEVRPYAAMGVSKLREITKLEDEDVEALAEGKTLADPDTGETYTLDDLKQMAAREVKESVEAVRREKEAYQAKAQAQEETIKRLKSEQEAMEEEVEEAQKKREEATELEAQYGPKAQTYEDNKKALTEAQELTLDLRRALFRADLDAESADGLKNLLLELTREVNAIHKDIRAHHAEALQSAEDTIELESDWEPSDEIMDKVAETNAENGEA